MKNKRCKSSFFFHRVASFRRTNGGPVWPFTRNRARETILPLCGMLPLQLCKLCNTVFLFRVTKLQTIFFESVTTYYAFDLLHLTNRLIFSVVQFQLFLFSNLRLCSVNLCSSSIRVIETLILAFFFLSKFEVNVFSSLYLI